MTIKIAERLHPFTHVPGSTCLLPRSFWQMEVFPTLLRFNHLLTFQKMEFKLEIPGPVADFTVEQNLEKGCVYVFGQGKKGYFRYLVSQEENGIVLVLEKACEKEILCRMSTEPPFLLKDKDSYFIPSTDGVCFSEASGERLSLGMHKSQDFSMVHRRRDLREIFPLWLRLGQMLPPLAFEGEKMGTLHLLGACEEAVRMNEKLNVIPSFLNLFLAGFKGILVPRLEDDQHQGLAPEFEKTKEHPSPLVLLKEGACLIRSLFFQEKEGKFCLLPCLPPEFHSGRFTQIKSAKGDEISIEWSKKMLRRAVLTPGSDGNVALSLQKAIKTFRIRRSRSERGKILNRDDEFAVKAGEIVYLDRFEK